MDDFVILVKNMKKLEERTIRFLKIAERHNLCFCNDLKLELRLQLRQRLEEG